MFWRLIVICIHWISCAASVLVDLTDFRDLHCSDLLLLHLFLNLGAHDLRAAQSLNELFIIQNVASGRAQQLKDLVFQVLQLCFGFGGFDDQIHALFFCGGLFSRHHDSKHLILQTILREPKRFLWMPMRKVGRLRYLYGGNMLKLKTC